MRGGRPQLARILNLSHASELRWNHEFAEFPYSNCLGPLRSCSPVQRRVSPPLGSSNLQLDSKKRSLSKPTQSTLR
jgi:hypothetical protein